MNGVYWAALGIGGSTLAGTACGFLFSRVTETWNEIVTAFAAGVMLAAAAFGLFAPAMDMVQGMDILLPAAGMVCGVLFLRIMGRISGKTGRKGILHAHPELMFVLALILHKFPEGMAGGVGLGGMNLSAARTMVIGISLQNLPEGIVMIPPLLNAGVGRFKTACIALATGLLNAMGVFAGALWGRLAGCVLPFALAFAGGAMLDVIVGSMLSRNSSRGSLITLGGFIIMACVNALC